jgi:hypothetical protein
LEYSFDREPTTTANDPRPAQLRNGHSLDRHAITECLCMRCGWFGPSARECGGCGVELGRYFCAKCNLWDSTPGKSIYHCDGRAKVRRRRADRPRKKPSGPGEEVAPPAIAPGAQDAQEAQEAQEEQEAQEAQEPRGGDGEAGGAVPAMVVEDLEGGGADDDSDGDESDHGEASASASASVSTSTSAGSSGSSATSSSSSSSSSSGSDPDSDYEYVDEDSSSPAAAAAASGGGCGICRVGRGLGIDYHHCPKCTMCVPINMRTAHKCIDNALATACPICSEHMFNSRRRVTLTRCGHPLHEECLSQYAEHAHNNDRFVTCPTCRKTLYDETATYRFIDAALATHEMPEELRDKIASILCNDCERVGEAPFHFQYHKCPHCGGYNTSVE